MIPSSGSRSITIAILARWYGKSRTLSWVDRTILMIVMTHTLEHSALALISRSRGEDVHETHAKSDCQRQLPALRHLKTPYHRHGQDDDDQVDNNVDDARSKNLSRVRAAMS